MNGSLTLALLPAFAPQGHVLDYVDATGNIGSLAMDGGRTEIEHGDVNGDGHPDLVLVGDHGSPNIGSMQHGVTVWLGDGAGGWTLVQNGNFGYGGVALGDADGDGKVDVAYGIHHDYSATDFGDELLEVALGDGSGGGWTPWDDGLATNGEDYGMFGTDLGDIDSDGDLDVGSTSFGCCAGVHVYRNHGDGTWSQSFGFLGGNADQDFEFADVNGDGHLDAVCSHQQGLVYIGDGAGGFGAANGNLPAQSGYRGLAAGDADGDGRDEVALVRSGGPEVWRWGPGNVWTEISGDLPLTGVYEATELADVDLDGRADLVAVGQGQIRMWRWTPGNAWVSLYSGQTSGNPPREVEALRCAVDLDHDGYLDLSIVQREHVTSFTYRNRHVVLFESSTPDALAIYVQEPSARRVWRGGQARFVEWTCAVPGSDLGSVSIELSTRGPSGPYALLASGLPNGGRHQLVAPANVDSITCHLRLTVTTASDTARAVSEPFAILGQVGVQACTSAPNSTGGAAVIDVVGSASLAHEDLRLSASPVPPGRSGLFFFGPNVAQLPYGNGTLCVASPQFRLPVGSTGASGVLEHELDFSHPPALLIQPGDTLHFQAWFLDQAAGGAGFDFSDARTIGFAP